MILLLGTSWKGLEQLGPSVWKTWDPDVAASDVGKV